jgi:hypothetical protein
MKMRNVVLMVVAVLVLALAPVAQATTMVLDPMTPGNILAPPGGWHDDRAYSPALLTESTFASPANSAGSMMIDYGKFTGSQYDVVPRGYFGWPGAMGTGSTLPAIPTLSTTDTFTFWWYKPAATGPLVVDGGVATGPSPECVDQIQIYSNTSPADNLASGLSSTQATFNVASGDESIPAGWHYVVAPLSEFVNTNPNNPIDLAHIDTIDFWVTCWGYVGPWGEPGSYQIMPTEQAVYISDLEIIPEPATMSLLAFGALALLKRRKA